MTRRDWIHLLKFLNSALPNEMTSLVNVLPVANDSFQIEGGTDLRIQADWLVHVGGGIRKEIEERLRNRLRNAASVHLEILMRPDPVLVFEIEAWMSEWLIPERIRAGHASQITVGLLSKHRQEWMKLSPGLCRFDIRELDKSFDVGDSSFTHSDTFGPQGFESHVDSFLSEMRSSAVECNEPPWIFWSRFPGWLKSRRLVSDNLRLSELAVGLAFQRTALSPQDEASEKESLNPEAVMLNPTFETVIEDTSSGQLPSGSPVLAFARTSASVAHRRLSLLEAALIDHIREAFRAGRHQTIEEIAVETGSRREFVIATLDGLIDDGFLLGSNVQSAQSH